MAHSTKRIPESKRAEVRAYFHKGYSVKRIVEVTGVSDTSVDRILKKMEDSIETEKVFTFTKEQLRTHNEVIKEKAYRKAAICTIKNLSVLTKLPIDKAMKKLHRYAEYLYETYKLDGK